MEIATDTTWVEILDQFVRTHRASLKFAQQVRQTFGVTGPELGTLIYIATYAPLSLGELAKKMRFHITTVEEYVNGLHKKRLAHKNRSAKDRRRVEVSISKKGRKLLDEVPKAKLPFFENFRALSDRELRTIHHTLVKLSRLFASPDAETD